MTVAYQGEPGCFSEEAARALLGAGARARPCASFPDAVAALLRGEAERVLLPVENTIAGPVPGVAALIARSGLHTVGEIRHPIRLYVIGCAGASIAGVTGVASHPVALLQCGRFLARRPHWRISPAEDTAGSVRRLIARGDCTQAAIAGAGAASRYGGEILAGPVEDHDANFTRFVLLARA